MPWSQSEKFLRILRNTLLTNNSHSFWFILTQSIRESPWSCFTHSWERHGKTSVFKPWEEELTIIFVGWKIFPAAELKSREGPEKLFCVFHGLVTNTHPLMLIFSWTVVLSHTALQSSAEFKFKIPKTGFYESFSRWKKWDSLLQEVMLSFSKNLSIPWHRYSSS